MSEENKINLLKRYLDLEKLPITGTCTDSNGDDRHSSGSFDSDDGFNEKGKKKDKKLQSVSKQFGSFGKSVGKKLKNLGKGKDEKKGPGNKTSKNPKLPITISAFSEMEQQSIWCCKIIKNPSNTHQKMIDNYLYDAGERFKVEVGSPRLQRRDNMSNDGRSSRSSQQLMTPCVTSGCSLYGSAETSYLCSKCFTDQKKHVIDHEKDKHKSHHHHHHDENKDVDATKIGKSKFYDMTDSSTDNKERRIPQKLTVDVNSQPRDPKSGSLSRQRTPSPDYDNVPYDKNIKHKNGANTVSAVQQKSPALKQKMFQSSGGDIGTKCRNPDCDFYGSAKTDNYCSGCYRNRKDLRHI